MVVMFETKELHLKFTFYADNTAAELNMSSGHVCMSAMLVEPSFIVMPLVVATAWPHIDCISYWSGDVNGVGLHVWKGRTADG